MVDDPIRNLIAGGLADRGE
ncbi:hypothetical protein A2U01_0100623, partial [Trifolium medium]|nr:hypothetical protein [Trifolium medium]